MKRTTDWILLIGDLVVILAFSFFRTFYYSSPPRPVFDLIIVLAPYPAAWLLVNESLGSWDSGLSTRLFVRKSAMTWIVSGILAEAVRGGVLWFAGHTIQHPLGSLLRIGEGVIYVTAWRTAFKTLFDLIAVPSHPVRKKLILGGLLSLVLMGLTTSFPFIYASFRHSKDVFALGSVPEAPAALVLGAGVYPGGAPSQVLIARVELAAELFQAGKVKRIVLSGGQQEAEAMSSLAIDYGVAEEALIVDPAGSGTFTSCYRTYVEYHLNRVIVITQRFHLSRAIFTCSGLGIDTVGVPAKDPYSSLRAQAAWYLREIPATALAWWQILSK
jgi:vancomycin permeability regulator SanA